MKKKTNQDRNLTAEKRTALSRENLEDDDFDGPADASEIDDLEWISPVGDSRSMAIRRRLELRLEELALRRDLEDFPDYHLLN